MCAVLSLSLLGCGGFLVHHGVCMMTCLVLHWKIELLIPRSASFLRIREITRAMPRHERIPYGTGTFDILKDTGFS